MTEKKTLAESIQEDIQRTGYPTEIVSASVMQERGWGVVHNPSYWDKEESQSREFDIRAYKQWMNAMSQTEVGVFLITECKKSDKPWVFFVTNESHKSLRIGRSIKAHVAKRRVFTDMEHQDSVITDDELRTFHHYFLKPRQARTFYEPLKNQEKASHSQMIYTAVMSVIKATLFHSSGQRYEKYARIHYPVIIFSGDLFEAFIRPDKSVELTRTSHVQLAFDYIQQAPSPNDSIWSAQQNFIVDVVHESYLDEFLKIIEDEHKLIADKFEQPSH